MSERAETGRRLALYGSNPVNRALGLTILAEEEPEAVKKLEKLVEEKSSGKKKVSKVRL